jgi:hypothetical protein
VSRAVRRSLARKKEKLAFAFAFAFASLFSHTLENDLTE